MAKLVSVRFCDKAFPVVCDAGELELKRNDFCIVAMPDGAEQTGYVQGYEYRCSCQKQGEGLPRIVRMADSHEVRAWHFLKRREAEALATCKRLAAKHKLEMKISAVHFDNRTHKVVFYFTAEKRVDFRELVKELASEFHARIELWQIGVRDETRRLGGIGVCGRDLCCASWIGEFAPVSIRFAKAQDIQFSPAKLSGTCGRLRCCLAFEQEQYVEMGKGVPNIGSRVTTERFGDTKVIDRNLLTETFTILDKEGQTHVIAFGDVEGLERFKRADEAHEAPETSEDRGDSHLGSQLPEDTTRRDNAGRAVRTETPGAGPAPSSDEKKVDDEEDSKRRSRLPRRRSRSARGKPEEGKAERSDKDGDNQKDEDSKSRRSKRRGRRGGRRRRSKASDPSGGGDSRSSEKKPSQGDGGSGGGKTTVVEPEDGSKKRRSRGNRKRRSRRGSSGSSASTDRGGGSD